MLAWSECVKTYYDCCMNISNIASSLPSPDLKTGAQYGAFNIAAKHCGLEQEPYPIIGEWQHGWIWPERNVHPEWVIGSAGTSFSVRKRRTFFVARPTDFVC